MEKTNSNAKLKTKFDEETISTFVKKDITYKCINSGVSRETKINNTRENQKTNCIECPFYFNVNFSVKKRCFEITKSCIEHNHPVFF